MADDEELAIEPTRDEIDRMEGPVLDSVRAAVARQALVLSSLAGATPTAGRTSNGRTARTP